MREEKTKNRKRNDIILIAVVLIIAIAYLAYRILVPKTEGSKVIVTVYGQEYATLPLQKDTTLEINGPKGGRNVLVIEDGTAKIIEASCPDSICIHQGEISKEKELIVCLPNQVVISVEGAEESELDSVVK